MFDEDASKEQLEYLRKVKAHKRMILILRILLLFVFFAL